MFMLILFIMIGVLMPIFFIERRQRVDDSQTLLLKCLSTFIIVFLSAINFYVFQGEVSYFALSIVGLSLCLIGDFLLGYCHIIGKGKKAYNIVRGVGMLVFMLAHVMFIINYGVHLDSFVWYYIFIPICVAILMFAFSPLAGLKFPHKAIAAISFFYMLAISLMLFFGVYYASSILMAGGDRAIVRGSLIIVASALFFTSDTILAFMYFGGKKGTPISIANLTTYYISLILLALAF